MNALIFTNNGVRHGVIGSANRSLTDNQVNLNVSVDGKTESYSPSSIVSADAMLRAEIQGSYPFVLVSKRDYRAISKLTPKARKPRTKKA